MSVHSTAIISDEAVLSPDVSVGPYAVIEGPVRIGPRCRILAHAIITGDTTLGADTTVGSHAIIGGEPQDLSYRPETESRVVVGCGNVIREYCTIHRGVEPGSVTTLGDRNFLMAGAHLAHNCRVGNDCIIANNVLLGGHVEVGDRVFIGGGCAFHQFVRIGELAITQGLSGFSCDIPPFTMAVLRQEVVGLNAVGLRRAGWTAAQRSELKRAFRLVFHSGLNIRQALDEAARGSWGPEAARFFEFIGQAKKRGICAPRLTRGAQSPSGDLET